LQERKTLISDFKVNESLSLRLLSASWLLGFFPSFQFRALRAIMLALALLPDAFRAFLLFGLEKALVQQFRVSE
jgi:hypothetical protein